MIGQHIYTRCTQGYFGRSAGDSTTLTITAGMFPIQEQEATIARICERIGGLEDTRKVPEVRDSENRGILKVVRVNDQITVVCRSRRISGRMFAGARDFRDFTYSDSFILTGQEKEKFFESPGGALLLENYEPYSSLQSRMNAYEKSNVSGYPPVDDRYSILNQGMEDLQGIFSELGLAGDLLDRYFYAILSCVLNRGSDAGIGSRVYVVLPPGCQAERARTGGSLPAEKLLLATYQVLPPFIAAVLNGISGGFLDSSGFLEPYQLVIADDPAVPVYGAGGYLIDLADKTSNVRIDESMALFLKDLVRCFGEDEKRAALDRNYQKLTGRTVLSEPGQGEIRLLELAVRLTLDPEAMQKLSSREVLDLCASTGPDRSDTLDRMLTESLQDMAQKASSGGAVSREMENAVLGLLVGGGLSEEQERMADTALLLSLFKGSSSQESLQRVREILDQDPARADRLLSGMSGAMDTDACRAETIRVFNEASVKYRSINAHLESLLDGQVVTWINGRLQKGRMADVLRCLGERAGLLKSGPVFTEDGTETQLFALLTVLLSDRDASIRGSAREFFARELSAARPKVREDVWKNYSKEYRKASAAGALCQEEQYGFILFAIQNDMTWVRDVWMRELFSFEERPENHPERENVKGLVKVLCIQNLWTDAQKSRVQQLNWAVLCRMLSSEGKWFLPALQDLEPLMVPLNMSQRRRDMRLSVLYTRYQAETDKVRFLRTYDGAPQIWEIIFASIWKGEYGNPLAEYATGYCESRDRLIEIYRNTSLIENADRETGPVTDLAKVYAELFQTEWSGEQDAAGPGTSSLAERFWKREQDSLSVLSPADPLYAGIMDSLSEWTGQNLQRKQTVSEEERPLFGEPSRHEDRVSSAHRDRVSSAHKDGAFSAHEDGSFSAVEDELKDRRKKMLMAGCAGALAVGILLAVALLLKISGNSGQKNTSETTTQTKAELLTESVNGKQTDTEESSGQSSTRSSAESGSQTTAQSSGQTDSQSSGAAGSGGSSGQRSAESGSQTTAQSSGQTGTQSSGAAGSGVSSGQRSAESGSQTTAQSSGHITAQSSASADGLRAKSPESSASSLSHGTA